jgi:PAS domain S-box-containing protein
MRVASSPTSHDVARNLCSFVDGLGDFAVTTLDAQGIVTSWNVGAETITGYKASEVVGKSFTLFYTPEDRAEGKPQRALHEAATRGRFEEIGTRVGQNGEVFSANVIISAIRDGEGRLLGFGTISRDVTDRLDATSRLRDSEARLQTLVDTVLETLIDGLIVIDRHGTVQLYNRAAERLFGFPATEVVGRSVAMLIPDEFVREHGQFLLNYPRTGVRRIIGATHEINGRRRDGSTIAIQLAVGEATHRGEPIYVGIIRDLTQRNRTEAQLRQAQKMEAVGQLTGGLAHDFNNILMVILANIDGLLEEPLSASATSKVEQIERSTTRGAELTRQLLAFSRRQPLQPRPTDLNELVTSLGRLLRRTLGADIAIEYNLAPGLGRANVDRAQLEAALMNLCLNARDAMPGGGQLRIETAAVEIDEAYVRLTPDARPGLHLMVAVTDSGTGIPPELVDRVFEPFFTTKDAGRGTGLGLSMVYGFIKQSNGHIRLTSELGRGTTVRLSLPRTAATAAEPAAEPRAAPVGGKERILVVEDEPHVRARLVEQLCSLGYAADGMPDGVAGLAAFERADPSYDLVVTDMVMPGPVGGKALADQVVRLRPGTPVVLISGYAAEAQFGVADPARHLLAKPFRKRELARIVREALDGRVP